MVKSTGLAVVDIRGTPLKQRLNVQHAKRNGKRHDVLDAVKGVETHNCVSLRVYLDSEINAYEGFGRREGL